MLTIRTRPPKPTVRGRWDTDDVVFERVGITIQALAFGMLAICAAIQVARSMRGH